jgi:hypothetical protein
MPAAGVCCPGAQLPGAQWRRTQICGGGDAAPLPGCWLTVAEPPGKVVASTHPCCLHCLSVAAVAGLVELREAGLRVLQLPCWPMWLWWLVYQVLYQQCPLAMLQLSL